MERLSYREVATNALRFWEPLRIVYNLALAVVTVACLLVSPAWLVFLKWWAILWLFVLAVGANVLYCAAYGVDIFVQLSDFRETWLKWRWTLFAAGLLCASSLTVFLLLFGFSPVPF